MLGNILKREIKTKQHLPHSSTFPGQGSVSWFVWLHPQTQLSVSTWQDQAQSRYAASDRHCTSFIRVFYTIPNFFFTIFVLCFYTLLHVKLNLTYRLRFFSSYKYINFASMWCPRFKIEDTCTCIFILTMYLPQICQMLKWYKSFCEVAGFFALSKNSNIHVQMYQSAWIIPPIFSFQWTFLNV